MINRTYICKLDSSIATLDIMVRDLAGTQALPVASAAAYGAANVTAAPADWIALCLTGAYYEVRGRTLRLEQLAAAGAAAGFVPRTRLGWDISVYPIVHAALNGNSGLLPTIGLSASLAAEFGDAAVITEPTVFPDPTYGPVIRLITTDDLIEQDRPRICVVHLSLPERKDEDFSNIGGP